jgi:hypothetical protein
MFDVCTLGQKAHIEAIVNFLPHSDQQAAVLHFSFTKAPHRLKLLIPASYFNRRWGITGELSPE